MKKTLTLIFLLFTTMASVQAQVDTYLKYGESGREVYKLQDYLAKKGFFHGPSSGFFGALTLNAVKKYQRNMHLPQTGFVGALTQASINSDVLQQAHNAPEPKDLNAPTLPISVSVIPQIATTTPQIPSTNLVNLPARSIRVDPVPAQNPIRAFIVLMASSTEFSIGSEKDLDFSSLKFITSEGTTTIQVSSVERQYADIRHCKNNICDIKFYLVKTNSAQEIISRGQSFRVYVADLEGNTIDKPFDGAVWYLNEKGI